jgi:hypothetical protein
LGRTETGSRLLFRQSQAEHDLKRSWKSNVDQVGTSFSVKPICTYDYCIINAYMLQ